MVKIRTLLSGLTVCIALLGYLPLQPYLDPIPRVLFPAALALGIYLDKKGRTLSERVLTPLSIVLFLYFASGFSLNNMIQVTADLLVVFLGIRMLGERSGRNYLQVFGISLFCLAASSLYNLSAQFIVYLLLLLLLLAVSLVVLTFHAQDHEIRLHKTEARKVLSVAGLMPVAALPILLLLFVVLPRTQYPLWDFMNQPAQARTGFADRVRPGSSSTVSAVKSVVFRATMPQVPDEKLYWRGIVLNGFKDNDWVRLDVPEDERIIRVGQGAAIHQEIYPEPSTNRYLLALNIPRGITGLRNSGSGDDVFMAAFTPDKRLKYQADSVASEVIAVKGEVDRDFYLALPKTLSERVRAKGLEFARPGTGVTEKLRLVEDFFRSQRIAYATTGLPVGGDPLGSFLFDKKRGHCELFASSAATLLRLAGVPARLVGGYRGGSYNAMGGYYLVTEDMAHVWVEAFDPARGWVTVDPSAWSIGFARNISAAQRIKMYGDALGFFWNKAVITYDLEKQISLFRAVGKRAGSVRLTAGFWKPLAGVAAASAILVGLTLVYLRRPRSREERILKRFLRAVGKRYPSAYREGAGLFELAEGVKDRRVAEFASLYGNAVYHDRPLNKEEVAKLDGIIRALSHHQS